MSQRKVLKEVNRVDSCLNKTLNPVKMSNVQEDGIQKLNLSINDKDQSKENVGALRRSKRKTAWSVNKSKISKEVTKLGSKKIKRSKAQVTKKSCEASSNSSFISKVIQEDIVANPVSNGMSNETNNSGLEASHCSSETPENITTFDMQSLLLNRSIIEDDLLTSTEPSEEYWKLLAEQRRIAIEETLYENETLKDQILVMETEITQLRNAADAAEKVLKAVGLLE